MERQRCCVPGCDSTINGNKDNLYFFPFLTKWLPIFRKKFGIPEWNFDSDSRICQRHFNTKHMRCSLTSNAVPTLFLEPVVSGISELGESSDSKDKELDSTGPSRLDPELIKDELSNVFLPLSRLSKLCYENRKRSYQMQSNQKNEIIDKRNDSNSKQRKFLKKTAVPSRNVLVGSTITKEQPAYSGSESEILSQRSINKEKVVAEERSCEEIKPTLQTTQDGSLLLDETQMKKEKLDEEVTVKEEVVSIQTEIDENEDYSLPQNDVFDVYSDEMKGKRHFCDDILIKECVLCHLLVKGSVTDHVNTYHRNGMDFHCPYCYQSKRCSLHSFQNEIRAHKGLLIINCQFCDDKFRTWFSLDEHLFHKHKDMIPRVCELCGGKDFVKGLIYHKFACHDGETLILKCDHCDFSTVNSSLLEKHVEMQHSTKTEEEPKKVTGKKTNIKCDFCDYNTKSINSYMIHLRMDHPESFH